MKTMMKTTLVAASIAAVFGANAGTLTVTEQTHSVEGLAGVTADQTSNSIAYKLGAAYREGDKVTFTFSEGALVATSFPTVINLPPVNSAVEADAIAGLTLGLLNSDANSVTFRVTKLTLPHNDATTPVEYQNGSTLGATLTLGSVKYKVAALAAPVVVSVSSQTTAGDILDSAGTRTGNIASAKSQFGTAVIDESFNAVIDVAQSRKSFVGGTNDSMEFTITNPNTLGADKAPGGTGVNADWLNLATTNTTAATLFGEAGKMTGLAGSNFATGGTNTFTEADAKLAISYTGLVTNDTVVFTPTTGDDADVLEAQKFTTDVVYNYTSAAAVAGSKTIATGLASGEWKLNGATVNIPYMPYSANASQIMYVTNAGNQAGDISVTAFDEKGKEWDLGIVAMAKGNTVTKVTADIQRALDTQGFTGGKLSITITVNAPAADITVYASYNAGSVRGFVNTDQYKGQ